MGNKCNCKNCNCKTKYGFYVVNCQNFRTIAEYIEVEDGDNYWNIIGSNETYYDDDIEIIKKIEI